MTARRLEPQTLLIVVAPTSTPNPAPSEACLAGFCPTPAPMTLPNKTSSTSLGSTPAFCRAARMATLPSSGAVSAANEPLNAPNGVRTPPVTYTFFSMSSSQSGALPLAADASSRIQRFRKSWRCYDAQAPHTCRLLAALDSGRGLYRSVITQDS